MKALAEGIERARADVAEDDAERAKHPELLVHDQVGVEAGCVGRAARPGQNDRPTGACEPHGLTERGGCFRGDVDDDMRERTSRASKRGDGILVVHVDREVRAELRGRGRKRNERSPCQADTSTNTNDRQ